VSVCGDIPGSSFKGDTLIRVLDVNHQQLASNDDYCGRGSQISFTTDKCMNVTIAVGCFRYWACSGVAAVRVK
jgi:alcohol dehydrogenase YqhD (iron-dependent ADH family)